MKKKKDTRTEETKPEKEFKPRYYMIPIPTFCQPKKEFQFGKRPILDSEWSSLARDLVKWAQEDDSLFIQEFPLKHGYAPTKFYRWAEADLHEEFTNALDYARYMLGIRRETRALNGQLDKTVIMSMMPLYNAEYKEFKMASEKKDEKNQITVVMEQAPDVGVPRKHNEMD